MKSYSFIMSLKRVLFGLQKAIAYERHMRVHVVITCVVIILSFLLSISLFEWCIILFCIAMVLCIELMNTSIEYLANLHHSHYDLRIKLIKDISASSVFVCSVIASIIGAIIFIPKCLILLKSWKVIVY